MNMLIKSGFIPGNIEENYVKTFRPVMQFFSHLFLFMISPGRSSPHWYQGTYIVQYKFLADMLDRDMNLNVRTGLFQKVWKRFRFKKEIVIPACLIVHHVILLSSSQLPEVVCYRGPEVAGWGGPEVILLPCILSDMIGSTQLFFTLLLILDLIKCKVYAPHIGAWWRGLLQSASFSFLHTDPILILDVLWMNAKHYMQLL